MGSLGGDCAGGGADEEPLGGAADPAPRAAAAGDAQCIVAFTRECGSFLAFIGEAALGRGEFGLAGFALAGEVVKRLQTFGGNDAVGLEGRRTCRSRVSVYKERGWLRKLEL